MVHIHRNEGYAYWPRCEEFGGVKTKHEAFNPILEGIDLPKVSENKKEVRKMKIFKKLEKDCKTCKYMDFSEDFPLDPVCDVELANGSRGDGITCCREKTWRSWEKRSWFKRRREGKVRKVRLRELDLKKAEELQSIFSQADIERAYNNTNAQGLQEYIEFLKNDMSEAYGIPPEILFGSREDAIEASGDYLATIEHASQALREQGHFLSTKIQLNKKDIDCWSKAKLSLLQRVYRKLFPIRWEVKEKVKAYETKYLLKNLTKEVDRFIAWGDQLRPMNEGGIIPYLSPIIEGRRLVTEEQHLLEEGLRREMEEQMRQAVLQNGMIPRSHGREHMSEELRHLYDIANSPQGLQITSNMAEDILQPPEEWQAEMMQNPHPTPEPQNYGNLQSYLLRQGLPLTPSSGLEANRITEAIREASLIISGIIGNRVGDMYNGRDDMYSERLERLCYTMVNRMITPNFTLNSIEYINRNERDFLESIRFSQRIVRDGSYEYENFQRVKPTIYQARLGDIIYLPKVLNIELRKGNLVVQNINGELVRTLIENDAIGVVEEPSFMTQDSDYRLVRIKMLKGVNVIIKNGTLVKKVKFKPKPKPKEFKVSDLITLRLEPTDRWNRNNYETRAKTQIYIKGKKFRQCKFLLLNLEVGNSYEEIESIDQAAELLEIKEEDLIDLDTLTDTMDDLKPNYDGQLEIPHRTKITIPPETEFWGHCSNLEVWVLYDYDLRVLHSNLSLPLLKELAQYDDHAKLRLKEQIAEKVEKGGYKAWKTHRGIINRHFNKEEREMLEKFIEKPKPKRPFVDLINEALDEFVSRDGMVYTPITIISTEKIRNMIPTNEAIIVMDFPEIEHWICPSDAIENTITLRDNEDKVFKIDISNLKIPKNLIKSRGIDISLDDLEEELDLEADTTEMRWDGDTTEAPSR